MTRSIHALSRRRFLLAGGAATAAAVVAGKTTTQGAASRKEKPAKQGYSASEHIRSYYRTAKV